MAKVNQVVLEVLAQTPTINPASITGAGVHQVVVEVLCQASSPKVYVHQAVLEVLVSQTEGSGGSGTRKSKTKTWVTF